MEDGYLHGRPGRQQADAGVIGGSGLKVALYSFVRLRGKAAQIERLVMATSKLSAVMGIFSNRVSRENLQPGDHVYSWRCAYSYAHHGIYAGDGKVIHFTRGQGQELGTGTFLDNFLTSTGSSPSHAYGPCPKCGLNKDSNGVLSSCIDCFLCGCPLYRFEYGQNMVVFLVKARGGTCTLALSDPSEEVLHRANYLLKNGFGCYHIFRNNCEDFAMYCKTGLLIVDGITVGTSGQAVSFLGAPLAALVSSPLGFLLAEPWGLLAVGAGMYCVSRYFADLGNRRGALKIPVQELVAKLGPATSAARQADPKRKK